MQPFTRVTATAVPIDLPNVDTDRVFRRASCARTGTCPSTRAFFHDVRFDADGAERPEFVLNQALYRGAKVVVAAENFGCGSSREAAVWALAAYGVRSVIAPSLGDIFHQNCFKNGLLPVILDSDAVAALRRQLHAAPGSAITVDLEAQTVTAPDGARHRFDVDAFRREMLLGGRDEIELTLGFEAQIREFEAHHAHGRWPGPSRRPGGEADSGRAAGSRGPQREPHDSRRTDMATLTVEYPKDLLKLVGRELGPSGVGHGRPGDDRQVRRRHRRPSVDPRRRRASEARDAGRQDDRPRLSHAVAGSADGLHAAGGQEPEPGINYGSNKIRFISPVQAGARIRVRQRITGAEEVTGNGVRVSSEMTVEIEGQERPALVGEIIGVRYA